MSADTSVTIFSSSQAGAPVLANVAGNLIAVLDACLVNGFGLKTCDSVVITAGVGVATISTGHSAIEDSVVLFSEATGALAALNGRRKVLSVGAFTVTFDASDLATGTVAGTIVMKQAAAGWVKPFSGTSLAGYKSANVQATGGYLRVDDTTGSYASVRGCESMTDINTYSGVSPTTTQQAVNVMAKGDSATAKAWWIIASDRFVDLAVAPQALYSTAFIIYGFGDVLSKKAGDAWKFGIFAGNSTSFSASAAHNPIPAAGGANHSKYLSRSYSAVGPSVAVSQVWMDSANQSGFSGYGGRDFPNRPDNAIDYSDIVLMEGNSYRGRLPGIFASPQNLQTGMADDAPLKDIPGFSGRLRYKHWAYDSTNRGGVFFDLTGPWGS